MNRLLFGISNFDFAFMGIAILYGFIVTNKKNQKKK
ncbi:hypothetical protein EV143_106280 [Flavobacterium chryseum]|nr:hypothetical protein EV143_106280 [Flavobacterium sp. P3160]